LSQLSFQLSQLCSFCSVGLFCKHRCGATHTHCNASSTAVWKSLPSFIINNGSLATFKSRLKTYFFRLSFDCSVHVWPHDIPASASEVTTFVAMALYKSVYYFFFCFTLGINVPEGGLKKLVKMYKIPCGIIIIIIRPSRRMLQCQLTYIAGLSVMWLRIQSITTQNSAGASIHICYGRMEQTISGYDGISTTCLRATLPWYPPGCAGCLYYEDFPKYTAIDRVKHRLNIEEITHSHGSARVF